MGSGVKRRFLKEMLKDNDPAAAPYLDNVPTRAILQKKVGLRISLVCKVSRVTGIEYDPEPGYQ